MAMSDFTGQRTLTIRDNTATTPTFVVLGANQIGSAGIVSEEDPNEITLATFAGDITLPNGLKTKASTVVVLPLTTADMGELFPQGFDAATGSWAMPIGGCDALDSDIAFEKVCDTKGNVLYKHVAISPAHKLEIARDNIYEVELKFYETPTLGSEYGLTGDNATKEFLRLIYDGTYNPTTGTVTFDASSTTTTA